MTLLLAGANIAAAYAITWDPLLINTYGFQSDHPSLKTAITCLFLHENVLHLLGNLLFMIAVGGSVELATGWFRFLSVYFISGLSGVGFHYLATRHALDVPPLIGASAAVAGCAGYYAIRYTWLRIPVAPKLSLSIFSITMIWFGLQVLGAVIRLGDTHAAMSYWAHIGGFATGFALSFVFRAPDIGQRQMDKEVLDAARLQSPVAHLEATRLYAKSHPADPVALRAWANMAEQMDEREEEFLALSRLIEIESLEDKIDDLSRICEIKRAIGIPAIKRLNFAKEVRGESPATAIKLLESINVEVESPVTPEALFLLADILFEVDRNHANQVLKTLTERFPDHPACVRARARGWLT